MHCGRSRLLHDRIFMKPYASDTLTLCVFVDAFGWALAQRNTDFLADVLPVRCALETVFGYSCTCDPTILTGKLPREHGHFSFFRYAPEKSPFARLEIRALGMLPDAVTGRGRVRHRLSRWLGGRLGYTGYFQIYNMPFTYLPLFDYTEKRDLYQQNGINNGCPTIFDRLRQEKTPFYCSDWRQNDDDNLLAASCILRDRSQPLRFLYLYLAGMDGILHAEGTHSANVGRKIADYGQQLWDIVRLARTRFGTVRVFLFSDHGMTDVVQLCDIQSRIAQTGLTFGKDFAAVYDSTMARFWFLKPGAREQIGNALCVEPLGQILSDETLAQWGCDFADRRYGEMFYLLQPGALLCPSFLGRTPLKGMHGYAPEHPDSTAFFATNAVEYANSCMPCRLDDLYDLMCREAGISSRIDEPVTPQVGVR